MRRYCLFFLVLFMQAFCQSQVFIRSELSTTLTTPWEIIYGPDNYLWLTEAGGKVSRVDPVSGKKKRRFIQRPIILLAAVSNNRHFVLTPS